MIEIIKFSKTGNVLGVSLKFEATLTYSKYELNNFSFLTLNQIKMLNSIKYINVTPLTFITLYTVKSKP